MPKNRTHGRDDMWDKRTQREIVKWKKGRERIWWKSSWIRNKDRWRKGTRKLHLQFDHASKEKIRLMDKKRVGEMCKGEIEKICDECETCIKLRRNPEKLVVGFPMGKIFNEAKGVDVGELEGEKFLVMIDLATHYWQGSWI